ncbi:helix-turn-helix domain-containing protein [Actinoplanes siamensis]|uniref:HTH iclR-type domain-containing protein n=1 Tax=Actinoplanes siamensis TaxID=1223317 RepID=A0A919NE26_9ACTN|nr:helix-turn-helix domain-containing protein [Actinoplanes siamensis]GIF08895.1 hypothetical protein Asi03nite_64330 [Actinoplanes siamensis]
MPRAWGNGRDRGSVAADPIRIDTTGDGGYGPDRVLLLALFAEGERTFTAERGRARPRRCRESRPARPGGPAAHLPEKIEHARLLKAQGDSLAEIARKTGIPKTSLHRYLTAPAAAADG